MVRNDVTKTKTTVTNIMQDGTPWSNVCRTGGLYQKYSAASPSAADDEWIIQTLMSDPC